MQQTTRYYASRDLPPSPPYLRLCVVSSAGGHLKEVLELIPRSGPFDIRFVVNDSINIDLPWPVDIITHAERDFRLFINFYEAFDYLIKYRPDVIISTGASPIVPFSIICKLFGCRVIFIETFGAVRVPSLTGRLMIRLADRFYYQWKTLGKYFPKGLFVGQVFKPNISNKNQFLEAKKKNNKHRISVFVAVGTSKNGFDRLLRWIDKICDVDKTRFHFYAQRGHSKYIPRNYESETFFTDDIIEEQIGLADVVICHAGAGLAGNCIRLGKYPILVPRMKCFGEAINDHQVSFANAMVETGQTLIVTEESHLVPAIENAAMPRSGKTYTDKHELRDAVLHDLLEFARDKGIVL